MRLISNLVQRWCHQPLHRRLRWALWLPAGVAVAALAAAAPGPLALGAGTAVVLLVALLGEPLVRSLRAGQAAPVAPAGPSAPQDAAAAAPSPDEITPALAAGDIHLQFRPLCALPSLRPCGLEARLQGLPPPQTLGVLPDALLGALLQAWLLPACQHFQRWLPALDRRGDAALWLPLPPPLLASPGLAEALDQALIRSGLGRERLRLCVHPVAAGRQAVLPEAARRLHQQGYTLVADGFGAGAASLAHLNQLPVRAVRLDRSLVERAGHGPAQRLVVESTARLAASLGMQTVADGLDSAVQAQALGMAGCRLGQGPLLGAWGPAEDWMPPQVLPDFADTA
jgi:EAL domain-containing protein (putative c-di-GMP-specific phosphodiesterase class I)